MKKAYILPAMDICTLDDADILTISVFNDQEGADPRGDIYNWQA